jgi:hypothetical protein
MLARDELREERLWLLDFSGVSYAEETGVSFIVPVFFF